jgi:tetratricopeptide (TPR) repeat protein
VPFFGDPTLSVGIAVVRARSYVQADLSATLRVCEEALGPDRTLGDVHLLARLLNLYAGPLLAQNRLDEAEAICSESLEMAERSDDHHRAAFNLWGLSKINRKRGDLDAARQFSVKMAEAYARHDTPMDRNRWIVLTERARLEQSDGHLGRAIEICREAHAVAELTKDPLADVQVVYYLGALLVISGAVDEACTHDCSLLKLSREELLPHGIAYAMQVLSGVAMARTEPETAARLLGYAEKRFRQQTIPRDFWVEVNPEWFLQPLRERFGENASAELMAEGAAWSEDRAIEEAVTV